MSVANAGQFLAGSAPLTRPLVLRLFDSAATHSRRMKTSLPILALLSSQALAMESPLPAAFSSERYEKLTDKSPFALATPVVAPPAPLAGFAANWYLTGVGRDEKGQDFVTIAARDLSVHFSLVGRETNVETGVSLASVNWADGYKKSTAILKKGTETGKVEFSQDEPIATPAQPAGVKQFGLGAQLPPVTVRPGGGAPPPLPGTQPRISLPRPNAVPVTVQPQQPVVQPAQPGQTPGSPPAGENRRRVRNIATPQ